MDFSAYRTVSAKTRTDSGKLGWVTLCGPPITFSKFSWRRGLFKPILFSKTFFVSYYFMFCFFILISICWSKPVINHVKKITHWKFFWHQRSGNVCLVEIWHFVRVPTFPCMCILGRSRYFPSKDIERLMWRPWFSYHEWPWTSRQDKN